MHQRLKLEFSFLGGLMPRLVGLGFSQKNIRLIQYTVLELGKSFSCPPVPKDARSYRKLLLGYTIVEQATKPARLFVNIATLAIPPQSE